MYHCRVLLRTRIRTAPDTFEQSQTSEYFEVGDEFEAAEIIIHKPFLEEWIRFIDPATGRTLYTAAYYPRSQYESKHFVDYEAKPPEELRLTSYKLDFVYLIDEMTAIDVTEYTNDGKETVTRFWKLHAPP